MKRWLNIYLVFLLILILACTRTKANVIFLYQKIHFYEVRTNLNIQPFATFIGGDGICAAEISENHISMPLISGENEAQTKLDKEYQFKANTLIYSNHEKTLSFLIEVEFNSINIPGLQKIKGYELKFYFDEQKYSCVQIISDHSDPFNNFKRYKFRIKDPSFLSHTNNWYTFYFGKVVVRALTTCDDKSSMGYKHGHLCAVGSSQSSPMEIGIKSEKLHDTFKIVPDMCKGHLMQQTCILRYSPFSDEKDHYYIILQAMSDEFETILGDTDIFSLEIDQLKKVEEARNSGKKSIYFESVEYFTDLDPNSLYFAPNLVSKRTQMFANGIVAKFLKSGERMNYVGILNEPSEKNVCFNESADSHKYCKCNQCKDKCTECYKIPKQENKNQVINYVPLNHDGLVKIKRSKHCSDYPFNLFNFDNNKMAFNFQNQDLSSVRKTSSLDESSYMLSNRDFLPRLCIDFKYGEAKGFFKLNILFNDYRRVAESNVLNSTHYRFNLYEYSYVDKEIHKKAYGKKFLFRLDVRPIAFIDPISSKQLVEIKHLKKGKYFLELQVKQRSKFCPGVDQCIDESAVNNEIICVKCNRLLIKFDLQSKMVSDSDSIEPKNKYTREHCHRIKPHIRIEQLDTKINFNNFKCPRESTVLTNIINNSNFDLNEIFFKTETLAGLLPNNFNLSFMMLPFDYSDQMDLIEFCDGIDFVDLIGNRYSSILNYAFTSNKKIVFYLSIFLSKEQQEKLNDFVLKYTNLLKLLNFTIKPNLNIYNF
ncbi:hypothetical protein BpHYR1_024602 [Brachionus plicatilis]|uniref:Uncharacterized protein n=1 Tax=Brachionus plicatilis TaxID=10195 RepID=A0A3M7SR97_BRAPC|nr:hypothetical protein BpHYR1_024602 [Brachionus plicatilis]